MAGAIQAHQDLAYQPPEADRLAAQPQDLDGGLHHGPRGLVRGERGVDAALRRGEQPVDRDEVRVPRPARNGRQHDIGAGPRPAGHRSGPRRHQLNHASGIPARLGQACGREPVAGGDATQHGRDQRLRPVALQEDHDPGVLRQHRLDPAQRPRDRRRLPTPGHPHPRPEQRLQRQRGRCLPAQDPRRAVVRPGQAVRRLPERRRTQREPDPRPERGIRQTLHLEAQAAQRPRGRLLEHHGGRPLREAAEVITQASRDGPPGAALQALHESTHHADAVLECEPRVALPPRGSARELHVALGDLQWGHATGGGRETAGGRDGVKEGEAKGGDDRRGPEVALDPLEDGAECRKLAGRVEVQQLVAQELAALEDREAVQEPVADLAALGVDRPLHVRGLEGRLAQGPAAKLVPADGAAVMLAGRPRAGRSPVLVGGLDGPGHLVQDDGPVAGGAPAGVAIGDPLLEAGLAPRRGRQGLDGCIEVAQVRRPQDDLGEEPVERAGLQADGLALAVDGRPGHPAAAAERVQDDVTGCGAGVQARVDERRRGRRRGALECREAEPRFGSKEERSTRHARDCRRPPGRGQAQGPTPLPANRSPDRLPGRRRNRPMAGISSRGSPCAGIPLRGIADVRPTDRISGRCHDLAERTSPACVPPSSLPSYVHRTDGCQPTRDDGPWHEHLARTRRVRPDTGQWAARRRNRPGYCPAGEHLAGGAGAHRRTRATAARAGSRTWCE